MLEQQRIEYLQAMGIQLWMPRMPVANAAESLWLAGDEAAQGNNNDANVAPIKIGHAADLLAVDHSKANTVADTTDASAVDNSKHSHAVPIQTQKPSINTESSAREESFSVTAEIDQSSRYDGVSAVDFTAPKFELYFALWPCGVLWVSSVPFEPKDQGLHSAVSYYLLRTAVPQANYSQFKWPYIEGSNEDQSTPVALRALTAQWDFMSSQSVRAWVCSDTLALEWLSKVASSPVFSVSNKEMFFTVNGKKQLWQQLQSLCNNTAS